MTGQFGAALVLNGFNYDKAQNTGVELKAVYTDGNFRAYANWAWANQRATNINTNQYLFGPDELAYIRNNWIYTDHSQVWTGSGGISYLWNGTRFTADVIYGSGLRSGDFNTDHNAPYAQVNAGMSREFDIPGWNPVTLRFDVVNVFDTSYALRDGSGIGVFARNTGRGAATISGWRRSSDRERTAATPTPPPCAGYAPLAVLRPARISKMRSKRCGPGPASTSAGTSATAPAGSPPIPSTAIFPSARRSRQTTSSMKHYGALGGGQAGFNWQSGMWLAGIETDMQFAHQRTATVSGCPGTICNPAIPLRCTGAP